MTRRTRMVLALAAVAGVGLAGCGSTGAPSAADDVPSLRVSLANVDDAMAAHRYVVAQKLLTQLIADVRQSRQSGDLEDATATDIIGAARGLLAELADRSGTPTKDASPSTPSDDEQTDRPSTRPTRTPTHQPTEQPSSESPPDPPTSAPSDPLPSSDPSPTSGAEPSTEKTPPATVPALTTPTAS